MSHRAAGVTFCAIAAFLFASRYLAAAIFGCGVPSWSAVLFNRMLTSVGNGLQIASVISLLIGVVYLVIAEVSWYRRSKLVKNSG
jgi:hypothetical protein